MDFHLLINKYIHSALKNFPEFQLSMASVEIEINCSFVEKMPLNIPVPAKLETRDKSCWLNSGFDGNPVNLKDAFFDSRVNVLSSAIQKRFLCAMKSKSIVINCQ